MAFTLEYQSAAEPSFVLDALRRQAPYWRESLVPPELRKKGAFGVASQIRPPRFLLYCESNREYGPTRYEVRGVVEPLAGGGTRVIARAGLIRAYFYPTVLLLAVAVWVFPSDSVVGILFVAITIVVALLDYWYDKKLTRESDPGARHLADRLDAAMATLPPLPGGER